MKLGKLKYARPYLRNLSQAPQMACQDGSAAAATTGNNACTLGTIDDTPGADSCGNGGLPVTDCTTGATAGTSTNLSNCTIGTVASNLCVTGAACAANGAGAGTGITYSACSGGTGVV